MNAMAAVNAALALILLALGVYEYRAARRMHAAAEQLRADGRAITDPSLRRATYDDFQRHLRGAR